MIVDVRNQVKQRLPGAVNFTVAKLQAMGKDFKSRKLKSLNKNLPGLGDKKAPIIVYADSTFSKEALRGYKELLSWGYKNVTILDGGLTEWEQKGFPLLNTPPESRIVYVKKLVPGEVASEEFENLVNTNKALVLDVRTPKEYAGGHIKTALHVPLDDLETNLAKIPKDREILIHCVAGARAQIAYNLLKGKGFEKARFLNATIEIDKQGKYTIL